MARMGDLAGVEEALVSGEDPNAAGHLNWTPLTLAAREGHAGVVRTLLANGADPNLAHPNSRTPLHFAAAKGHVETIRVLVAAGAAMEAANSRHETPLLEAAMFNRSEAVEVLLGLGSNGDAKDASGKTASDWLKKGGVQGQGEAALSRLLGPKIDGLYAARPKAVEHLRRMMAEYSNPDEWGAHYGRNTLVFSYGIYRFEDAGMHSWVQRVWAILKNPELLTACEERYLDAEELAEARERRKKLRRREQREALSHGRNPGLT